MGMLSAGAYTEIVKKLLIKPTRLAMKGVCC